MKKTKYLILTLSALLLWSCNFSVGTKKDLMTGLSYSYNGFAVDDVFFVGPDNTVKRNNEVELDTEVAIVVEGLVNYVLQDDKAFPGLMLSVTDEQGVAILDEADLFANTEGYSAEDASILRGTVTVGNPMKPGESYQVKMRVWDKNKPENELTAQLKIDVK